MKRKLKKAMSLILSAVMVFGLIGTSLSAFADSVAGYTEETHLADGTVYRWTCPNCGGFDHNIAFYCSGSNIHFVGGITFTCDNCKLSWSTPSVSDAEFLAYKEKTCTEDGYRVFDVKVTCGYNGEYYWPLIVTDRASHTMGDWYTTVEPTDSTDGEERRDCEKCDYFETREIPALGHTYGDPTFEWSDDYSSCTAVFECVEGDDTQTVVCTVVEDSITAPTCTEKGKQVFHAVCTFDGEEYESEPVTLYTDELGHAWDNGVVAKEATCVEDGEMLYTCTREGCNATMTEPIPAVGYHLYGDWVTVLEPTCTEAGKEERYCSVCGDAQEEQLPAKGHNPVTDEAVEPTCTAVGWTEGSHCSVCDEVLEEQMEIPALGHDMGAWYTTKEPTCTATGTERRDCSRCDYYETDTIPASGHEFSKDVYSFAWYTDDGDEIACNIFFPCQRESCDYITEMPCDVTVTTVDPTCTEDGYTDYYAEYVYEEDAEKVNDADDAEEIEPFAFTKEDGTYTWSDNHIVTIDTLGHEFNDEDYYFTWDSAENEDGEFEPECQIHFPCQRDDCDYEAVFDCDVTVTTTDPTCTEDGETDYYAVWAYTDEETDETYTFDDTETVTIDALGHEWGKPVFNWDNFNLETGEGTVTAIFTCVRGCEEIVECTVTFEEDGNDIVYTAVVEFNGEEFTDTAVYEGSETVTEIPDDDNTGDSTTVDKGTGTSTDTSTEPTTATNGNTVDTVDYGGKSSDTESPKTGDTILSISYAVAVAALATIGGVALIRKHKENV